MMRLSSITPRTTPKHPALVFSVKSCPDTATWLLGRRAELGDAFGQISRPVFSAFWVRTASIDNIGAAMVSQQQGQTEVIGLPLPHTTMLDDVVCGRGTRSNAVSGRSPRSPGSGWGFRFYNG